MTIEVLLSVPEGAEDSEDGVATEAATGVSRSRLRLLEREAALAFEAFQVALLDRPASLRADPREWIYPGVTITLSLDGAADITEQDVVFDGSLFAQLIGLYVGFGWSAIDAVAKESLMAASPVAGIESSSGGSDPITQTASSIYVRSCIQLLANLIYDGLVYLEQRLRERAIESLTLVSGRVNEAFTRLKLRPKQVSTRPTFQFASADVVLERDLHFALTRFAKAYRRILDTAAQASALRGRIETLPAEAALLALASDVPVAGTDEASVSQALEEAQNALAALEAAKERDIKVVTDLGAAIKQYFPAALPVGLLVSPADSVTTVTNKLGQFYWALGKKTDQLKSEIPFDSRFVHRVLRRPVYRRTDAIEAVLFAIPEAGLELTVARAAMATGEPPVDGQLLSDIDSIEALIGSEALPVGSLEHAVACQYLFALYRVMAMQEAAQQDAETVNGAAMRLSAALSLLSLIPVLRPLRVASAVIDAVLFARFVTNACALLRALDLEVDRVVLNGTGATFDGLGKVGELVDQRRQLVSQLEEEGVKQLALLGAAQLRYVRGAVSVRAYYTDLEVLLERSK
jgi:hypothetical protein